MKKPYQIESQRAVKELEAMATDGNPAVQMVLPMAEVVGWLRKGMGELIRQAGLQLMDLLMQEEVRDLVGERSQRQAERTANRWGSERGYCVVMGQKVPVERPRVRTTDDKEVRLGSYEMFHRGEPLTETVWEKLMLGLSTRRYGQAVRQFTEAYGLEKIVIKPLLFAVCFVFECASLLAQKPGWQPSPGHTQVPIWPRTPPGAQFGPPPNTETMPEPGEIDNVSRPTMTVYSPKGKNTGAAVVVFPGGGYYVLAIDLEGTEVCDWLTSKGITCVLLKYRVPNSGMHGEGPGGRRQVKPKAPMALEDAQRTVGLVRFHAAEYHIDPHKIGVLGFSAGGHLVT